VGVEIGDANLENIFCHEARHDTGTRRCVHNGIRHKLTGQEARQFLKVSQAPAVETVRHETSRGRYRGCNGIERVARHTAHSDLSLIVDPDG
jgi:hypothetical protein